MTFTAIPNYVFAAITISLGGLVNGLDTGSIGAITGMKQFERSIGYLSPFLLGFTVSLIMLTAAIPSVFAGHLADRFGRLKGLSAWIDESSRTNKYISSH
jgi:MFS family permease